MFFSTDARTERAGNEVVMITSLSLKPDVIRGIQ